LSVTLNLTKHQDKNENLLMEDFGIVMGDSCGVIMYKGTLLSFKRTKDGTLGNGLVSFEKIL